MAEQERKRELWPIVTILHGKLINKEERRNENYQIQNQITKILDFFSDHKHCE